MTIYITKTFTLFHFPHFFWCGDSFSLTLFLSIHFLFKNILFFFSFHMCVNFSIFFLIFFFFSLLITTQLFFLVEFFLFFFDLLLPNLNIYMTLLKYNSSPILRQGTSSCFSFFFGSRVQNKQNKHFMAQMGTQGITHSHMTSFYLAK